MPTLEHRVSALESANPPADELTIIRHIVSPELANSEIHHLRDDDGKLWTRKPGETEQELIDRASLEVKRNAIGVARLIGDDGGASTD